MSENVAEAPQVDWRAGLPDEVKSVAEAKGWKSPADAVKSYAELEKKLGKPAELQIQKPAEVKRLTDRLGVDQAALVKEYTETGGKLGPETIKKLEASGIHPDDVRETLSYAQKASRFDDVQRELVWKQANDITGGEAQTKAVLDWAKDNLDEGEKAAINDAMKGSAWGYAFGGLVNRFREATGADRGKMVEGSTPAKSGTAGFSSRAEMAKALGDPRYKHDADYKRQVNEKLIATPDPHTLS